MTTKNPYLRTRRDDAVARETYDATKYWSAVGDNASIACHDAYTAFAGANAAQLGGSGREAPRSACLPIRPNALPLSVLNDRAARRISGHVSERKEHRSAWKVVAAVVFSTTVLGGCANMTPRQQNTAIGAAIGAVAGSILTDGDGVGTVGGAAVGGYIGNQVRR